MPQSAEASAEPLPHVRLPHRQEAFARHVASGRTLTDAARLAGYAWDSARQTGSRLMKEPQVAARVAGIAHAKEDQRQGELDELVAGLKRLMIDTMERKNDFAALRAIDMIARLRGLVPTTAKRSGDVEAALEEMHRLSEEDEEAAGAEAEPEPELPAPLETVFDPPVFDPPMPPELPQPVEPAPVPKPDRHSAEQARATAKQAARAEAERRIFRYEHLMAHHPKLSPKIQELSDARAYFDDSDTLLPPELWPDQVQPAGPE